jgi:hypothetical protein
VIYHTVSAEAGHQNRKFGCNFKESLLPLHFPPGYLPDRQVIDEVLKVLSMSHCRTQNDLLSVTLLTAPILHESQQPLLL